MTPAAGSPHPNLKRHPGFQRLFRPGPLTVGLILPLETHHGRPAPTMHDHVAMAQRADELGFGAFWMREVDSCGERYRGAWSVFRK